jgi:lipoprotein-anchoring transpeptidase ErfK/SrfK
VCVGKVDLMARPDDASAVVGALFEDAVVPWVHERVGTRPLYFNQRWVETPEGYIYAPYLQPVRNLPNAPLTTLPQRGDKAGTWMEVSVPYADIILANPPARSPWLKASTLPRVYYSQILWVDQLYTAMDGTPMYRVNERYGSYGDIFYVPAAALRPMTEEEVAPISPDASDKRVEVDVTYQTMTCYEGNSEVFYARISTGAKFDAEGNAVDKWSTPVGPHPIWRKLLSVHMSGGSTGGGYDLAGIGWTALFSGEGVAIHSTFWHNNFGVPMSHGCVNARPQDAQWVWRWTNPSASLEPGDVTIQGEGSTKVVVVER